MDFLTILPIGLVQKKKMTQASFFLNQACRNAILQTDFFGLKDR